LSELETQAVRAAPRVDRKPSDALTAATLKRRLLRGSAWMLTGKVVTTILGLVINASVARLLPPAEYGSFLIVFSLVALGSTIAQLGLDRAVVRLVSASLGTSHPGRARRAILIVFVGGGLAAIGLGAILVLGLGDWLATRVYHSTVVAGAIPLAAGWLVATAVQSLLVETFRGMQRFALAMIFDALLVDILVASVVTSLWLLHHRPSLDQIVLLFGSTTLVATVVAAGIMFGRVRRLQGDSEGEPEVREVLAIAWPLLITNVATYLLGTGVDLWVLGAFRSHQEVAVYGAASRLMFLVVTPFLIMQGVVAPIVAELAARGRIRELERTVRFVATLAGIPAFVSLVAFLVAGGPVMGFLYGPFYRQGATILFVLSCGRLIAVWTGSCAVTLIMTGHQRVVMFITISFGLLSVVAGALLASQFGAIGIAFATSAVAAGQNLFTLLVAKRRVGVWTNAYLSLRPVMEFLRPSPHGGSGSE
jgi:O-antigen/teichoic acid export membrane protein